MITLRIDGSKAIIRQALVNEDISNLLAEAVIGVVTLRTLAKNRGEDYGQWFDDQVIELIAGKFDDVIAEDLKNEVG